MLIPNIHELFAQRVEFLWTHEQACDDGSKCVGHIVCPDLLDQLSETGKPAPTELFFNEVAVC